MYNCDEITKVTPRISILMPVWNAERFLAQAVESILSQTVEDFELLAVDGGSTDGTLDILSKCKDSRLRILKAPPGIVAALNLGIEQARGEWVARQDADDISHRRRLEMQLEATKLYARSGVLSHRRGINWR